MAGIGGGSVSTALLMAMYKFTTKPAIAISSFKVLLTTAARFVQNFRERHPEKPNVTSIDYDLIALMMPTTLAGSVIGALILVIFPALIIDIVLTIVLGLLTLQAFCKAVKLTKKENALIASAKVIPQKETDSPSPSTGIQTELATMVNRTEIGEDHTGLELVPSNGVEIEGDQNQLTLVVGSSRQDWEPPS